MADEYPFTPYPFSDPFSEPVSQPARQPEPPGTKTFGAPSAPSSFSPPAFSAPPFSAPSAQTFQAPASPASSASPVAPALSAAFASPAPPFSVPTESSFLTDDKENAVQKTALAKERPSGAVLSSRASARPIVAGILVILLLAGFGIWHFFLRERQGSGEIPQEESDANLIVAAFGGKILTPEGASLFVPPGALLQDTRLEISKVSDGDATDLFELKPLGQKFLKPVTVEIPYKKSGPIILEYWREEGEKKRVLQYTMDRKEKKLRTQVREF